jgi:hypothetical protein
MSAEVSDVSLIQDEDLLRRMVSDRVHSHSFVTCLPALNVTLKWFELLLRFRKLPVRTSARRSTLLKEMFYLTGAYPGKICDVTWKLATTPSS